MPASVCARIVPMLILALDTSTRVGSIAFLQDSQVLDEVSSRDETPYSIRLFRDLALLQSRAQFRMDQIDVFAVGAGPGSFTGLRVGLTAVKAWAEVMGSPSRRLAVWRQLRPKQRLMGARRGLVWSCWRHILTPGGGKFSDRPTAASAGSSTAVELVGEEAILSAEEFLSLVKGNLGAAHSLLVSPTPDVLPRALVDSILPGARIEEVSAILAPVIGRLAFDRASCGELVDSLGLDANYIRRTDAEVFWKGG